MQCIVYFPGGKLKKLMSPNLLMITFGPKALVKHTDWLMKAAENKPFFMESCPFRCLNLLGLKCSKWILSVALPRAFSAKQLEQFAERAFCKEQYMRLYWNAPETLKFKALGLVLLL